MSTIFIKYASTFLLACFFVYGFSQAGTVTAGGDAQGSNGSVSYSVGQVFFNSVYDESGTLLEGLQQPFEITTVGTSELTHEFSLKLFPNPTMGTLTLEVGNYSGENLSYMLFDLSGRQSAKGPTEGNQTQISMETLAPGTYFLTLLQDQKAIETFKIIKNN